MTVSYRSFREIVEELVKKYFPDYTIVYDSGIFGVNLVLKIVFVPSEAEVREEAKVAALPIDKYIELCLEHEKQHVINEEYKRRNCPDTIEKVARAIQSIVEDHVIDFVQLPKWKRDAAERELRYYRKLWDRFIRRNPEWLETTYVRCTLQKSLDDCYELLKAISLISEGTLDFLEKEHPELVKVLRELKRDLGKAIEAAKKDLCQGLRKLAEICEKYGLRCVP